MTKKEKDKPYLERRRLRDVFQYIGIIVLPLLFITCGDDHPKGQVFFVRENHEYGNGRNLELYWPDNIPSVYPVSYLDLSFHNLWCRDPDSLVITTTNPQTNPELYPMHPLYIHRLSGRIDTLYHTHHVISAPEDDFRPRAYGVGGVHIGYIHRECKVKGFYVMETKLPGESLGKKYISDFKDIGKDTLLYDLAYYTYEGQEKVFESELSHFWIANSSTTDLYGPLTEEELVVQLEQLGVRLPIKLKNPYDRYVYPKRHDVYIDSISYVVNMDSVPPFYTPKHFSWPFWNVRKPKIISH
jgi:hypothetical protein